MHGGDEKRVHNFVGRDRSGNLDTDGRIILK
jgi:hypothetical protein